MDAWGRRVGRDDGTHLSPFRPVRPTKRSLTTLRHRSSSQRYTYVYASVHRRTVWGRRKPGGLRYYIRGKNSTAGYRDDQRRRLDANATPIRHTGNTYDHDASGTTLTEQVRGTKTVHVHGVVSLIRNLVVSLPCSHVTTR